MHVLLYNFNVIDSTYPTMYIIFRNVIFSDKQNIEDHLLFHCQWDKVNHKIFG